MVRAIYLKIEKKQQYICLKSLEKSGTTFKIELDRAEEIEAFKPCSYSLPIHSYQAK